MNDDVTDGYVLSVIAAVILGSYLIAVKRYFSHYPPTLFVALSYVVGVAWYLPFVLLTVPTDRIVPAVGPLGAVVLLGTAAFTSLALLTFYKALAIGDVSYVAPISKIIPVFVLPLEVLLLGQYVSLVQITGVVVATAAVYVANYRSGSLLAPLRKLIETRSALLALASAASFGVVDVGKRISMQELGIAPEGFVLTMFLLVPILLLPATIRNRHAVDWWSDRWLLGAAGVVLVSGQHVVAMAFEALPASIVSPIVNTQAVVAVILASLLLGESRIKIRLTAAGIAVFGIVLISLG